MVVEIKVDLQPKVMATGVEAPQESAEVDARLSQALAGDGGEAQVAGGPAKPLKANDIDYSALQKGDRSRACELATRSLNEVNDLVRVFNKDFHAKPYTPPYDDFPKPEQFAQFKKGERYNLWADAVKEWVEDCKQDMQAERDANLADLQSEFNAKIDRNLVALCAGFEITLEMMQTMFEEVKGDMAKFYEKINAAIRNAQNAVIANDNANAAGLHNHIEGVTDGIHQHISYESGAIHNHIQYEADRLHEQIFDEAEFLADEIDGVRSDVQQVGQDVQQVRQNQEDEQERNRIKAYIANCWQNKPIVTQGLLREFYRSKGKHIDKPGGLLPVPDRDNNALQSIIENMSLQELKEFEAMLRSNRATADID